jgi:protein-disulfide isomerase
LFGRYAKGWNMKIGIGTAVALVAFTALVTWGISRPRTAMLGPGAPAEVLADVGDIEITRQEVEELAPDQFIQAKQQLHDLTERALDEIIGRKLVELEAANRGVDEDSLLALEVEAHVPEPSEAQIDSVYEVYRDQITVPRDSIAPQIVEFLSRQRRALAMEVFLAQLRSRHEVHNYLEPRRIDVEAVGPARGPADAPITLVEFSDFECPFCYRVLPTLEQVEETYGDRVRIVYRQFPLNAIHPSAQIAAEASLCADAQGKFWEMHDAIFEVRGKVGAEDLKRMAADLDLDSEAFASCLDSGEMKSRVAADVQAGRQAGVSGTPALFINGRYLSGAQPFSVVSRIIDDELVRIGG